MQIENVTTGQIKALWGTVESLYVTWAARCRTPEEREEAELWRAHLLYSLTRLRRVRERRFAGRMFAELLCYTLEQWQQFAQNYETSAEVRAPVGSPTLAALEAENTRLRNQVETLQRQQAPTSVEIPAQTVTLRSAVDREILRLMATTGQARSWRLVAQVLAAGLTENGNTVRNAFKRLKGQGLIEDYTWNERPQAWSPGPGGGRQLLRLTERGRLWAETAFQIQALPCELSELVPRHKGVSHAVAIIEARDHLRAAGYVVNDAPDPLLVSGDERWGQRAEPDLTATRDGVVWPVEVQREVDERNNAKWVKSLELVPRVALVTLSAQMCDKQALILRGAMRRMELPPGEIRLISLEAMETEDWHWLVLRS